MKIMKKYSLFAALTAVFLTLLVIACGDSLDTSGNNSPMQGNIRIYIGGNSAKTIMPTFKTAAKFLLTFTDDCDTAFDFWIIPDNNAIDITLEDGIYNEVEIYALPNAASQNINTTIARGYVDFSQETPLIISDGISTKPSISINLDWMTYKNSTGGTGTFDYTVDLSSLKSVTISSGSAVITGMTSPYNDTINFTGSTQSDFSLAPGAYSIVTTLTSDQGITQFIRETFHIYKNLTSSYTLSGLTDSYFRGDDQPTGIIIKMPSSNIGEKLVLTLISSTRGDVNDPADYDNIWDEDGRIIIDVSKPDEIKVQVSHIDNEPVTWQWYSPIYGFTALNDIGGSENSITIKGDYHTFHNTTLAPRDIYSFHVMSSDGYMVDFDVKIIGRQ